MFDTYIVTSDRPVVLYELRTTDLAMAIDTLPWRSHGTLDALCLAMALLRTLTVGALMTSGCAAEPSEIMVSLAPEIVSSLDGTLTVHAILLADREPVSGEPLSIAVDYTDRNGMSHAIAPASGETNEAGSVAATLTGLDWDGAGTVTVTGADVTGTASFGVLDRTPPKVTITPPAANTVRRGQDITIEVQTSDEIGISQVFFGTSFRDRDRSLITSGATGLTLHFDFQVPDVAPGTTIMLFALAEDMSNNQGAAMPITVTVVP